MSARFLTEKDVIKCPHLGTLNVPPDNDSPSLKCNGEVVLTREQVLSPLALFNGCANTNAPCTNIDSITPTFSTPTFTVAGKDVLYSDDKLMTSGGQCTIELNDTANTISRGTAGKVAKNVNEQATSSMQEEDEKDEEDNDDFDFPSGLILLARYSDIIHYSANIAIPSIVESVSSVTLVHSTESKNLKGIFEKGLKPVNSGTMWFNYHKNAGAGVTIMGKMVDLYYRFPRSVIRNAKKFPIEEAIKLTEEHIASLSSRNQKRINGNPARKKNWYYKHLRELIDQRQPQVWKIPEVEVEVKSGKIIKQRLEYIAVPPEKWNKVRLDYARGKGIEKESGRRRDYSRRPPTPPDVRFRIRRFV